VVCVVTGSGSDESSIKTPTAELNVWASENLRLYFSPAVKDRNDLDHTAETGQRRPEADDTATDYLWVNDEIVAQYARVKYELRTLT
jgi:hypothetical protein